MRIAKIVALSAVLACVTLTAVSAPPESTEVPAYDVQIMLKSRDKKKEEIVLLARVTDGQSQEIRKTSQRPFVTGLTVMGITEKKLIMQPIIQVIDEGAVADVKISETNTGAYLIDATIEVMKIGIVGEKPYPGTEEYHVQTVRVGTAKTRLVEAIATNEKLKSTLSIAKQSYDVTLTVVRRNSN